MRVLSGGSGDRTLLLLHGLGATADVWTGVVESWPGRWVAPDLPGHGGSEPLERYSFGALAAAVAGLLDEDTVVLGHSLGGVVALALGTGWFGPGATSVVGLGIKVRWTPEDLARAAALAARPAAEFPTRAEAAARHLRVAGLTGLIDPDDPRVDPGLRRTGDTWRLALDQRVFGVGAPDLRGLLAASRSRHVLARGEHDPMVTDAQLPDGETLPGLGHNAHVENPAAVLELVSW